MHVAEGSARRLEKSGFGAFPSGLFLACGFSTLTGVVYAFGACLWLLAQPLREKVAKQFPTARRALVAVDGVAPPGTGPDRDKGLDFCGGSGKFPPNFPKGHP